MSSETVQSKEMSHVVYDAELLEKKYGFKLPSQKYVTGTRSLKCEDHSLFFKSFKCSTCHPACQSLCLMCCIKSHVGHVIQKVDEIEIIPLSSESFQLISPVNVETKAKTEHVPIVSPAESVSDIESVEMDMLIEEVRCDANFSLKYCELSLASKSASGFHKNQNSEPIVERKVVSSEQPVIVASSVGPLEEGNQRCLDRTKSVVATELSVSLGELSHLTLHSFSTANVATAANTSTEVEINTPASVTYSKHSDGDGVELLCDTFGIESVAAADREVSDKPDSFTAAANVESSTQGGWNVEGVNVAPSIPMEVSEDATAEESLAPNIVTTEDSATQPSLSPIQCTQLLIVCEPVDYVVVGELRTIATDGDSGILVARSRKRKAAAMSGANDIADPPGDVEPSDMKHQPISDAPMSIDPLVAPLTELCGADALLLLSRSSSSTALPSTSDVEVPDVEAPDSSKQSPILSELLVATEYVAADPMETDAGDNTTAAVAVISEVTESVVPITTCDKQGAETKTTAVYNEDAASVSSVHTCGSPAFPTLSFPTVPTVPGVSSEVVVKQTQPVLAEKRLPVAGADTATLDHSEHAKTTTPTTTDHTEAITQTAPETTVPTQTPPQLTASTANTVHTLPAPAANDYILFGYAEVPDAALCDMSLGLGYVSAVSEGKNMGRYRLEHMMLPLDEKNMLHTAYEMDVQQGEEVLIDSDSIACSGILFVKGKRKTRSGDAQWHLTEKSQQAIKRVKLFRDIFGEQGRKV